jgi:uncharacterized membrane protein
MSKVFALGFSSGLRSTAPLAVLAWSRGSGLPRLRGRLGKTLVTGGALAELVVDKLPSTPNRTSPAFLAGRLALGATAGFLVSRRFLGACVGALGALAGSFGGFRARQLVTGGGKRNAWAAVLEDALAIGVARRAART